jgi:hypothetical protein
LHCQPDETSELLINRRRENVSLPGGSPRLDDRFGQFPPVMGYFSRGRGSSAHPWEFRFFCFAQLKVFDDALFKILDD